MSAPRTCRVRNLIRTRARNRAWNRPEDPSLKCPACRSVMFVVEYDRVELDICQRCQGVWFDRGELELVLEQDETFEPTVTTTSERKRDCPLCRRTMGKVNIGPAGGVLVDVCPSGCGLWFDRGEVGDLIGELRDAGRTLPASVTGFLSRMFPAADR